MSPLPSYSTVHTFHRSFSSYICLTTKTNIDRLLGVGHGSHSPLVEHDRSLDGSLVLHRLQALLPLLQLERLVHDAIDLDLALICSPSPLASFSPIHARVGSRWNTYQDSRWLRGTCMSR